MTVEELNIDIFHYDIMCCEDTTCMHYLPAPRSDSYTTVLFLWLVGGQGGAEVAMTS